MPRGSADLYGHGTAEEIYHGARVGWRAAHPFVAIDDYNLLFDTEKRRTNDSQFKIHLWCQFNGWQKSFSDAVKPEYWGDKFSVLSAYINGVFERALKEGKVIARFRKGIRGRRGRGGHDAGAFGEHSDGAGGGSAEVDASGEGVERSSPGPGRDRGVTDLVVFNTGLSLWARPADLYMVMELVSPAEARKDSMKRSWRVKSIPRGVFIPGRSEATDAPVHGGGGNGRFTWRREDLMRYLQCDADTPPPPPSYITDVADLYFDPTLKVRAELDHLLKCKDRLPRWVLQKYGPDSDSTRGDSGYASPAAGGGSDGADGGSGGDAELRKAVKAAIERARKEAATSPRVAIPQYYDGQVQLLLPLHFGIRDPYKPDIAVVVARVRTGGGEGRAPSPDGRGWSPPDAHHSPSDVYVIKTWSPLTWVYPRARLLGRIDDSWARYALEPDADAETNERLSGGATTRGAAAGAGAATAANYDHEGAQLLTCSRQHCRKQRWLNHKTLKFSPCCSMACESLASSSGQRLKQVIDLADATAILDTLKEEQARGTTRGSSAAGGALTAGGSSSSSSSSSSREPGSGGSGSGSPVKPPRTPTKAQIESGRKLAKTGKAVADIGSTVAFAAAGAAALGWVKSDHKVVKAARDIADTLTEAGQVGMALGRSEAGDEGDGDDDVPREVIEESIAMSAGAGGGLPPTSPAFRSPGAAGADSLPSHHPPLGPRKSSTASTGSYASTMSGSSGASPAALAARSSYAQPSAYITSIKSVTLEGEHGVSVAIEQAFSRYGTVAKVQLKQHKDGNAHFGFVHFSKWHDTPEAQSLRVSLEAGDRVAVPVLDDTDKEAPAGGEASAASGAGGGDDELSRLRQNIADVESRGQWHVTRVRSKGY